MSVSRMRMASAAAPLSFVFCAVHCVVLCQRALSAYVFPVHISWSMDGVIEGCLPFCLSPVQYPIFTLPFLFPSSALSLSTSSFFLSFFLFPFPSLPRLSYSPPPSLTPSNSAQPSSTYTLALLHSHSYISFPSPSFLPSILTHTPNHLAFFLFINIH